MISETYPPRASADLAVGDNISVTSIGSARPQLVIFDLDGTLADSAAGVLSSFRQAMGAVGAEIPSGDLVGLVVGPPMIHTMTALGLGDRAADAVAAYREDYTNRGWAINSLFEGVADLLEDLSSSGVRLAVATSKAESIAKRILEHHGVAQYFDVIAGANMNGERSSKVEVLAHALAQLQPLPELVVMVGDRAHDVEGAAEHGIATIVVGWGYGQSDFEGKSTVAPAAQVATVGELREVLCV